MTAYPAPVDLCIRLTDRTSVRCASCDHDLHGYDESFGIFAVGDVDLAFCDVCAAHHDPEIARLYVALVMLGSGDGDEAVNAYYDEALFAPDPNINPITPTLVRN